METALDYYQEKRKQTKTVRTKPAPRRGEIIGARCSRQKGENNRKSSEYYEFFPMEMWEEGLRERERRFVTAKRIRKEVGTLSCYTKGPTCGGVCSIKCVSLIMIKLINDGEETI
ncbi:hypothetical protein EPD60_07765 [Flaviaesturariibacter flavus]|uniref:Uncharacterized protein n=1 Tax=Flaviaesturariibacter flavus TaxID=2502780 RepID=A0A4R1BFF7_9BACT|nr:hypothetical protein [Flaviaesturariibacter flavus]TCJ15847.1 hypothetical protein EPD60_07765 [Flaviaesturariibacter flavus]